MYNYPYVVHPGHSSKYDLRIVQSDDYGSFWDTADSLIEADYNLPAKIRDFDFTGETIFHGVSLAPAVPSAKGAGRIPYSPVLVVNGQDHRRSQRDLQARVSGVLDEVCRVHRRQATHTPAGWPFQTRRRSRPPAVAGCRRLANGASRTPPRSIDNRPQQGAEIQDVGAGLPGSRRSYSALTTA